MDIDKLYKSKMTEGTSPVEENIWQNIEGKINSSASSSSYQTSNGKSFLSKTWQAMSVPAKIISSIIVSAIVVSTTLLVINNTDSETNTYKEQTTNLDPESIPEKNIIMDSSDNNNSQDPTAKTTQLWQRSYDKEPVFEIYDEEDNYNLNENYHPAMPTKIENTPTSVAPNPKIEETTPKTSNNQQQNTNDNNRKIDIMIPNYITPNADGINDCFQIKNIDKYPDNTLIIKDRKGKTVFKQSHYSGGFCGENCVVGTYFFSLNIRNGSHTESFTGTLEILK